MTKRAISKPKTAPKCWGTGKCENDRGKECCGWIGTCFESILESLRSQRKQTLDWMKHSRDIENMLDKTLLDRNNKEKEITKLKAEKRKLKKNQCNHHPMQIRSSYEVRAEMKRQDDEAKREGHWQ